MTCLLKIVYVLFDKNCVFYLLKTVYVSCLLKTVYVLFAKNCVFYLLRTVYVLLAKNCVCLIC